MIDATILIRAADNVSSCHWSRRRRQSEWKVTHHIRSSQLSMSQSGGSRMSWCTKASSVLESRNLEVWLRSNSTWIDADADANINIFLLCHVPCIPPPTLHNVAERSNEQWLFVFINALRWCAYSHRQSLTSRAQSNSAVQVRASENSPKPVNRPTSRQAGRQADQLSKLRCRRDSLIVYYWAGLTGSSNKTVVGHEHHQNLSLIMTNIMTNDKVTKIILCCIRYQS